MEPPDQSKLSPGKREPAKGIFSSIVFRSALANIFRVQINRAHQTGNGDFGQDTGKNMKQTFQHNEHLARRVGFPGAKLFAFGGFSIAGLEAKSTLRCTEARSTILRPPNSSK